MALTDVVGAEQHPLCGEPAGDLVGLDVAEAHSSLMHCNGFWFSSPFTPQEKGIRALLSAWPGFLTLSAPSGSPGII